MGRMNIFTLLRAGISAFNYPINETLTDYESESGMLCVHQNVHQRCTISLLPAFY